MGCKNTVSILFGDVLTVCIHVIGLHAGHATRSGMLLLDRAVSLVCRSRETWCVH
jgi:hypothetical protein